MEAQCKTVSEHKKEVEAQRKSLQAQCKSLFEEKKQVQAQYKSLFDDHLRFLGETNAEIASLQSQLRKNTSQQKQNKQDEHEKNVIALNVIRAQQTSAIAKITEEVEEKMKAVRKQSAEQVAAQARRGQEPGELVQERDMWKARCLAAEKKCLAAEKNVQTFIDNFQTAFPVRV